MSQRGYYPVRVGEKTYHMKFSFEALEWLEETTRVKVTQLRKVFKNMGMKDLRILVQAAQLHEFQEETDPNERDRKAKARAYEIMNAAGENDGLDGMVESLLYAFYHCMGGEKAVQEAKNEVRVRTIQERKRKNGPGQKSNVTPLGQRN